MSHNEQLFIMWRGLARSRSNLWIVMLALTLNIVFVGGATETCKFLGEDVQKVTPKFKKPSLLKNAFTWQEDASATQQFIRANLGNITLHVTDDVALQSRVHNAPNAKNMQLQDWMDASAKREAPPYVFHWCKGACLQQLSSVLPLPLDLMKQFTFECFLSMGQQGLGIPLHSHGPTWVAQFSGSKTWLVAPPGEPPVAPYQNYQADASEKLLQCTQHEGEIVFLPSGWWHTTANSDWSVAVGCQAEPNMEGVPANLQRYVARAAMGNVSALQDMDSEDEDSPLREGKKSESMLLLRTAITNGHIKVVKLVLGEKPQLTKPFAGQLFADVAANGHAGLARWLLKDFKISKKDVRKAVNAAVEGGGEDIVSLLLKARAPVNDPDEIEQPLHVAVRHGHARMVQLLLKAGAKLDAKNPDGYTSLDISSGKCGPGTMSMFQDGCEMHEKSVLGPAYTAVRLLLEKEHALPGNQEL